MRLTELTDWVRARATGRPTQAEARGDPWRRLLHLEPPLRAYGPGADRDFSAYLGRETGVRARTPGEVAAWLLTCRYASDDDLLGEADAWLHPTTLELVRSGDCEDYALWGWSRLLEGGYDAEFVVGMRRRRDGATERHAWVTYRDATAGTETIFDGVETTLERIIRPLHAARDEYEPQVGVAADGRRFVFAGLFLAPWGRQLLLRRRRTLAAGP